MKTLILPFLVLASAANRKMANYPDLMPRVVKCTRIVCAATVIMLISGSVSAQNAQKLSSTNGDLISALAEEGNNMWIGTSAGLVRVNKTDGSELFYNTSNSGLPGNSVNCIAVDPNGVKWIATNSGLATFDGTNWTIYDVLNSGLPYNYVSKVAVDQEGVKWIATYNCCVGLGFGLTSFDGRNWFTYTELNSVIPSSTINDITIDADGGVWTATREGVGYFDGVSWQRFNTFNSGLANNFVSIITIDQDNKKWIGCNVHNFGGVLCEYNGNTWVNHNLPFTGQQKNWICTINIDSEGIAWIGTSMGLYSFIDNSWMPYNTSDSGLPNDWLSEVLIDKQGLKWLGTYDGLLKVCNSDGSIWVGTVSSGGKGQGLAKFRGVYVQSEEQTHDMKLPDASGWSEVFPNPAEEYFSVQVPSKGRLYLINMNGIVVKQQEVAEGLQNVDITEFCCGVYVIRLVGEYGINYGKIIVSK